MAVLRRVVGSPALLRRPAERAKEIGGRTDAVSDRAAWGLHSKD